MIRDKTILDLRRLLNLLDDVPARRTKEEQAAVIEQLERTPEQKMSAASQKIEGTSLYMTPEMLSRLREVQSKRRH